MRDGVERRSEGEAISNWYFSLWSADSQTPQDPIIIKTPDKINPASVLEKHRIQTIPKFFTVVSAPPGIVKPVFPFTGRSMEGRYTIPTAARRILTAQINKSHII